MALRSASALPATNCTPDAHKPRGLGIGMGSALSYGEQAQRLLLAAANNDVARANACLAEATRDSSVDTSGGSRGGAEATDAVLAAVAAARESSTGNTAVHVAAALGHHHVVEAIVGADEAAGEALAGARNDVRCAHSRHVLRVRCTWAPPRLRDHSRRSRSRAHAHRS